MKCKIFENYAKLNYYPLRLKSELEYDILYLTVFVKSV